MKSVTTALVTLVVVVYAVVGGVVFQLLEKDNEEAIRVDVHQRLDVFLGPYARHPRHRYRWGGNVTSVGWQVTLCDPMWHVSSRSDVATLRAAIHTCYLLTYLLYIARQWRRFDSYLCRLVFAAILWAKLSEMFAATVIPLK